MVPVVRQYRERHAPPGPSAGDPPPGRLASRATRRRGRLSRPPNAPGSALRTSSPRSAAHGQRGQVPDGVAIADESRALPGGQRVLSIARHSRSTPPCWRCSSRRTGEARLHLHPALLVAALASGAGQFPGGPSRPRRGPPDRGAAGGLRGDRARSGPGDAWRVDPPGRHGGVGLAHHADRGHRPRRARTWWPARLRSSGSSTCRCATWPTPRSSTRSAGAFRAARFPTATDGSFPVWFFEVEGELIWGATARMIHELLQVVLLPARSTGPAG